MARQLLLERSRLPIIKAPEQIAGLQTQYAPSAYVGLWSRLQSFPRHALTKALEQRRAVRATLMRATIHIVSRRDYVLFVAGIRNSRREWWLRAQRHQAEGLDLNKAAEVLRRHLAYGPRRQAELTKALQAEGLPRIAWSGAGLWLDLVRVPPSGTWERRRADLYGLAHDWIGPATASEAEGLVHLVRRHLRGFGPATLNDIGTWAGLPITTLRPVVEGMRLRRFHDQEGGELVDLQRAPLPDAAAPAPVRFMPTWDASLLVHARRTQILPEHYRPLVFNTKTPHSVPTFMVDGAVAGTWRYTGDRVELKSFEALPRATRRHLENEAARLTAFHAD